MIRQTVYAGNECNARAAHAFINARVFAVRKNQVETIVRGAHPLQVSQVFLDGTDGLQDAGDQRTAAWCAGTLLLRRPVIRQRSEAPRARDSEPRASRHEIAPGENLRPVGPPMRSLGRALKRFVSVGCDDARIPGMSPPGNENQAHRQLALETP